MGELAFEIEGVILSPLRRIPAAGGDVYRGIRSQDTGFVGFAEAYFTTIESGSVKPWKCHLRMTLNLIVIEGHVRFAIHDDRAKSQSRGLTKVFDLGPQINYCRLTIAPKLWVAFAGADSATSIILNVANMVHDPDEVVRRPLEDTPFEWRNQ